MSGSRPVADLVGLAKESRTSLRAAISAIVAPNRDARELFVDESGELKPAAARLIGLMASKAELDRQRFEPDARRQDYLLGQQHMVRFLTGMLDLDERRLHQLQLQLGERQ